MAYFGADGTVALSARTEPKAFAKVFTISFCASVVGV
jgi:hypothetical protein